MFSTGVRSYPRLNLPGAILQQSPVFHSSRFPKTFSWPTFNKPTDETSTVSLKTNLTLFVHHTCCQKGHLFISLSARENMGRDMKALSVTLTIISSIFAPALTPKALLTVWPMRKFFYGQTTLFCKSSITCSLNSLNLILFSPPIWIIFSRILPTRLLPLRLLLMTILHRCNSIPSYSMLTRQHLLLLHPHLQSLTRPFLI